MLGSQKELEAPSVRILTKIKAAFARFPAEVKKESAEDPKEVKGASDGVIADFEAATCTSLYAQASPDDHSLLIGRDEVKCTLFLYETLTACSGQFQ